MTPGFPEDSTANTFRIGTAGWSVPALNANPFSSSGPHLARYSQVLSAAEINSSFHRPHRPSTYQRWAAATPPHFRFSVKAPKFITHQSRLKPPPELLQTFLHEAQHLGEKLGPLLFQLPPSLAFDQLIADNFFKLLRGLYPQGQLALEPRHPTWFTPEALALLQHHCVARVIADPPRTPDADPLHTPNIASASLVYFRLHGSPRTYYSSYTGEYLTALAENIALQNPLADTWVIFDNTASGAAIQNALHLIRLTSPAPFESPPSVHRLP